MSSKKQTIKCSNCEHCSGYRPLGNTRSRFRCKHPDQRYILDYFRAKRILIFLKTAQDYGEF